MKGLIYKDFVLSKKYYIMAFIYSFMFALIAALVRLSMICGNLAHDEEVLNSLGRNIYVLRYIPCLVFLFAFSVDGGALYSDFNCKWVRFCNTTSLKEKNITAAKMLSITISETVAFIISLIYVTIFGGIGGSIPDLGILRNLTAMYLIVLGVSFVNIALCYAFMKKQTVELIFTAVGSIVGIVFSFLMILKLNTIDTSEDFDLLDFFRSEYGWIKVYLLPIALAFVTIMAVVCYYVSVKVLQRREN